LKPYVSPRGRPTLAPEDDIGEDVRDLLKEELPSTVTPDLEMPTQLFEQMTTADPDVNEGYDGLPPQEPLTVDTHAEEDMVVQIPPVVDEDMELAQALNKVGMRVEPELPPESIPVPVEIQLPAIPVVTPITKKVTPPPVKKPLFPTRIQPPRMVNAGPALQPYTKTISRILSVTQEGTGTSYKVAYSDGSEAIVGELRDDVFFNLAKRVFARTVDANRAREEYYRSSTT
jgi:hypothetical protein